MDGNYVVAVIQFTTSIFHYSRFIILYSIKNLIDLKYARGDTFEHGN